MNKGEILQYFGKHYENRYIVYVSSIKSDKNNSFFIVKDNNKKYLVVSSADVVARKFGGPEDLIGACVWLASDASKFVTGIIVPIDGGFNAYSGV